MQKIIAFLLLFVSLPLLLLILLLSLPTQGLPIFFIQERVGLNRKSFNIYKLRTMGNGKITSFGRILRKTGLDELPQLINILKGEMLLIGPRPLTLDDIVRLGWNEKEYDLRWSVPPGITGLSQVSNICSKENTWKLDSTYCKNTSFKQDIRIICLSLSKLFRGKSEVR